VRRMNCETMRFRDWIGRAHGQPPAYGLRSTSTISLLTKTSAEGNRRRPAQLGIGRPPDPEWLPGVLKQYIHAMALRQRPAIVIRSEVGTDRLCL